MASPTASWLVASSDEVKSPSKAAAMLKDLKTRLASSNGGQLKVACSEKSAVLTRLKTHQFHGVNKTQRVEEIYELGEEIGKGAFGVCFQAKDKATGGLFCCKSIPKASLTDEMFADIQLEAEVMMHLRGHPHIVAIMGMFEDDTHIHIVEELCSGGDLYSKLTQTPVPYTEVEAASIMRTVLEVLQYVHSMGVIYRDCKPDNFLLSTKGPDAILKATDFGISKFVLPGQMLEEFCGTPTFMAPEVFNMSYSFPSDVWSAGVMMYWILSGEYPYKGRNKMELARKVCADAPTFTGPVWEQVTPDAVDCLKRMLVKDPSQRATTTDLLNHKWFKVMAGAKVKPLGNLVLQRMQAFAQMHDFKKEVMRYIATCLDDAYLIGLRTMFAAMDVDKSGSLSFAEIAKALEHQGAKVDHTELRNLMNIIDDDHDGTLDFNEFVSATINSSVLERQELLKQAFRHFDRDGDGNISRAELATSLREKNMKDKAIDKILAEVDKNADGLVDFDEFCSMLLECPESGQEGFKLRWRITKQVAGLFSDRKTNTNLPNLQPLSRAASRKNSEAGYSPRPGSSAGWKELVSSNTPARSPRESHNESGTCSPAERKPRRPSLFMTPTGMDVALSDEASQLSKLSGLLSRIGIQLGTARSSSGGLSSPQTTEVLPYRPPACSTGQAPLPASCIEGHSSTQDQQPRPPSCLRKVSGQAKPSRDSLKNSQGGGSPPLSIHDCTSHSQGGGAQARVSKRISWVMDSQNMAQGLHHLASGDGPCGPGSHQPNIMEDAALGPDNAQPACNGSEHSGLHPPVASDNNKSQGVIFLDTNELHTQLAHQHMAIPPPLVCTPSQSGSAITTPFAAWSGLPDTCDHQVVAQHPPGQSPTPSNERAACQAAPSTCGLPAHLQSGSLHEDRLAPSSHPVDRFSSSVEDDSAMCIQGRASINSAEWPAAAGGGPRKQSSFLSSTFECFGALDRHSDHPAKHVAAGLPSEGAQRGVSSKQNSWTLSTVDGGFGQRLSGKRSSPRSPLASADSAALHEAGLSRGTPGRPFKRDSIDRARDCSIQ